LEYGNNVPAENFGYNRNFTITCVNAFGTSGKPMATIHEGCFSFLLKGNAGEKQRQDCDNTIALKLFGYTYKLVNYLS